MLIDLRPEQCANETTGATHSSDSISVLHIQEVLKQGLFGSDMSLPHLFLLPWDSGLQSELFCTFFEQKVVNFCNANQQIPISF